MIHWTASAVCDQCGLSGGSLSKTEAPAAAREVMALVRQHGWQIIQENMFCYVCAAGRKLRPEDLPGPFCEACLLTTTGMSLWQPSGVGPPPWAPWLFDDARGATVCSLCALHGDEAVAIQICLRRAGNLAQWDLTFPASKEAACLEPEPEKEIDETFFDLPKEIAR